MKNAEMLSLELSLKKRRDTVLEKIENLSKSRESFVAERHEQNKASRERINLIDKLTQLLKISYDYHHHKPVYTPPVTDDENEVDGNAEILKEHISRRRYANFCVELQNLLEKMYDHPELQSRYIVRNAVSPTNAVTYHEDYPFYCEGGYEQRLFYENIYYREKLALLNNHYQLKILRTKSIGYNKELKHLCLHLEALERKPLPLRFPTSTPKVKSRRLVDSLERMGVSDGIDVEKVKFTK